MQITLMEYPNDHDWTEVKRRALVTVGKIPLSAPGFKWKNAILEARHSPIRRLRFSFLLEDVPSWVAVHLCRHHVGCQPYVRSQRNDRQSDYDRNKAPQDAPVNLIWDLNGETLMEVANKRLCNQASPETRAVVRKMCELVIEKCPEFQQHLVPMCVYHGGVCHEMFPCQAKP